MAMYDVLRRCLDDLEQRLDAQEEARIQGEWIAFGENDITDGIFSPKRRGLWPPAFEWPQIGVNQALEDYDAMALQQFGAVSALLSAGGGAIPNVRCNYGSSILPLLFGVKLFLMAAELNTLPTSEPLQDAGAVQRLIDAGVPDLNTGYGARVFVMARRYVELLSNYPKLHEAVFIYHPDLQGPMDVCEVVWGSSFFVNLYETPDLVHAFLNLICESYSAFMDAWTAIVPFREGYNAHWGYLHKGNLMLRDDSAMNLSPAMFDEFIRPYDQRLLAQHGGGAIHFCGRGDHYIASMSEIEGLHAIAMSQPELNDMEVIYRHTVDKGIKLLGLRRDAAEGALARGRSLHGQVHSA